jgi:hypothetical protein
VRTWLASSCLIVVLGGCATAPASSGSAGEHTTAVHPGDAAVSVLGTPFYLVFKGTVCAASAVIAAPFAGLVALSESPFAPEARRELREGLDHNCGPPYVLSPYREAAIAPPAEAPKAPAREPPEEPPTADPANPAPSKSALPRTSMLEQPLQSPPDQALPPTLDDVFEPGAGAPIKLFSE